MKYDEILKPHLLHSRDGIDFFIFDNKFLVRIGTNVEPPSDAEAENRTHFLCEITTLVKKDGRWDGYPYQYYLRNVTEAEVNQYLQSVLADAYKYKKD